MKIRTKFIASTLMVVSVSLILSGLFTNNYVTRILREQAIKDSMTKLAQISSQIQKVQDTAVKTTEYIVSDNEINTLIIPNSSASLEQTYFQKYNIQEKLKRFTALNISILNVMIVRNDGEVFSSNSGYGDYFTGYLQESWFVPFRENRLKRGFSIPHNFFFSNGLQKVISYVVSYRNSEDKTSEKYFLVLDIGYSEIANAFSKGQNDFEQILLFNEEADILFNSRSDRKYEDYVGHTFLSNQNFFENNDYIAITDNVMKDGWMQAGIISKTKLFDKINKMYIYLLFILLSSFLFILIMILPLILNITKPILKLTQAMRRVSTGDLIPQISIKSGDEMEILGSGFNLMVTQLKHQIESSIQHEELKRQMQINLLMSQINPHFLYNTLNTVIYLSEARRNEDVAKITTALIDILQDTIKTGEGGVFSTLREEKSIIHKYVEIQQYRYPEKFRLEWAIDDNLMDIIIPRMLIQPLVENALFHGICASENFGIISIGARLEEKHIILSVEDNGIGMEQQTLEQVQTFSHNGNNADSIRGIGLSNIKNRIQFHYGEDCDLNIRSAPLAGTVVSFRLPNYGPKKALKKVPVFYTK
ncbi:sensor histidine kinase [Paenibacillus periandrae]|uniref:sensor histidine kinase n=1 Tax=Paenibacillus periandrae TaxID=1761741 RepID=UPI001F090081|nr:histidine kinase [Paenibacillus periandrae]